MMKKLSRRGLFGFGAEKPPAKPKAGFSLEDFYRKRADHAAPEATLPPVRLRKGLPDARALTTRIGVPTQTRRRKP